MRVLLGSRELRRLGGHARAPAAARAYTTAAIARMRVSAEGQEGLRAFLEKRKPQWLDES